MKSTGKKEELLEEIKNTPITQLKKNKSTLISRIIQGQHSEKEQIDLRRELQKRFIEEIEGKEKHKTELAGTEEEIKKQCSMTSQAAKKLAESDGKLSRIKRSQEKISEEMRRAEITLGKKRMKDLREEVLFIGAFGLFIAICCYILIDKFVLK